MENTNITNKKNQFINHFKKVDDKLKKQIHYNSVLNITDGLLRIKNKRDSRDYLELVSEYFEVIENIELPINKLASLKLFNKYLYEPSKYLMFKGNFISNTDFQRVTFFGFVLDLILFFLGYLESIFFVPIFTMIFFIIGFLKKRKAIKEGRFFNNRW